MSRRARLRYSPKTMLEITLLVLLCLFVVVATVVFIIVYYWGPKGPTKR